METLRFTRDFTVLLCEFSDSVVKKSILHDLNFTKVHRVAV